ncbi:MAG: TIGR01244 family sulfur transferase [Geminicoccaceae bacterium]
MRQAPFRKVAGDYFVAPQLQPEDFTAAQGAGIRTIINNRPDGEVPDQLSDAEAGQLAMSLGLDYAYVPVVSGQMSFADVKALAAVLAEHPGPYLAYCRSGTRSCHLWACATVSQRPVDETLAAAAAAGYDLSPMRGVLERLISG